jgi:hypothetical protein
MGVTLTQHEVQFGTELCTSLFHSFPQLLGPPSRVKNYVFLVSVQAALKMKWNFDGDKRSLGTRFEPSSFRIRNSIGVDSTAMFSTNCWAQTTRSVSLWQFRLLTVFSVIDSASLYTNRKLKCEWCSDLCFLADWLVGTRDLPTVCVIIHHQSR